VPEYIAPVEPVDDEDPEELQQLINEFAKCHDRFVEMLKRVQRLLKSMKWDEHYSEIRRHMLDLFADEVFDYENVALCIESWVLQQTNETNGILSTEVEHVLKILFDIQRVEGSDEFDDVTSSFFEDLWIEEIGNVDLPPGQFMSARTYSTRYASSRSYSSGTTVSYTSYRRTLDDEDTTSLDNLKFYSGQEANKEYKLNFDEFIIKVERDFKFLESAHNYIQFIFPVREKGLYTAQPLSKYEAESFRKSPVIQKNIIRAYRMILEFYGLNLRDEVTGTVSRTEDFEERYRNMNTFTHNNLRMTRILKFLGSVGFEHFKKPLVLHWIEEIFKNHFLLNSASACVEYWIPTLRRESELIEAEQLVLRLTGMYIKRSNYEHEEESWACQRVSIRDEEGGNFQEIVEERVTETPPLDAESKAKTSELQSLMDVCTGTQEGTPNEDTAPPPISNGEQNDDSNPAEPAQPSKISIKNFMREQPEYPQGIQPLKVFAWKKTVSSRSETRKRKRVAIDSPSEKTGLSSKKQRLEPTGE